MEYACGTVGRVFLARVDHGEDLVQAITALVEREKVETGFFVLLGALESGRMTQGPASLALPPVPLSIAFADGREVLGAGDVLRTDGVPSIHLHIATGRDGAAATGCLRDDARVYAVVEVVLFELGLGARRYLDPSTGLSRISFSP
jgi:predicted DNA-binding protein with PD1-like motif